MNAEDFFNQLPEGNVRWFAKHLKLQLTRIDGISVYHTNANGGDLRVRMDHQGRVIMTMYWQPMNNGFFFRIFLDANELQGYPIASIKIEPDYQPLLSSFRINAGFDNTSDMVNLICSMNDITKKAIARLYNHN